MKRLFPNRTYKSGSRWAFWRWTDVRSEYIVRLHLIQTPFGAIMLHWLKKPDPEPWLHDHPVTFLSLILRGGYGERRQLLYKPSVDGLFLTEFRWHRWFNFIRATPNDRHQIVSVLPNTLTLCLMTPKTREWGFHTPTGWLYWKDYYVLVASGATNGSSHFSPPDEERA